MYLAHNISQMYILQMYILQMCVFEHLYVQYTRNTFIQTRYCCILGSNISPSSFGILNIIRYLNLLPLIIYWIPIGNCTHSNITVTKFLAKITILWMSMTTTMWIMESNI